ncbi:unnamed protein product [Acanthoscelides obtectus]|nr:unnamed protein product [Acanthoscelides obtectus]CAK1620579.1 hypothetical protein AOBTE_LOCUS457 [Acanthoscelides obtectus]
MVAVFCTVSYAFSIDAPVPYGLQRRIVSGITRERRETKSQELPREAERDLELSESAYAPYPYYPYFYPYSHYYHYPYVLVGK